MCDLGPLIREVEENPLRPIEFYEYPELYHFFYSRVDSHRDGDGLLAQFQPHNTTRVLELACGTGLQLARIEDQYQTVMGVDIDAGMLDVARDITTGATLREADVTSWSAADEGLTFDAAFMVGAMFHLTEDEDVRALAENLHESLRHGGSFSTSFIPFENVDGNNLHISKTVESDRYRVEQNKTAVLTSTEGHITSTYLYDVSDTDDDTTVTVGSVNEERRHDAERVQQMFFDAGFTTAELIGTDTPKVILVARR